MSQNLHESCLLDFLARMETLDMKTLSLPTTQETIRLMRSPFATSGGQTTIRPMPLGRGFRQPPNQPPIGSPLV